MNAIQTMHNVLMIMTPWDNPIPLTRAWCVFELYAVTKTKSRFEVGMTVEENARFLKEMRANPRNYYKMLGTINSSKATAFKDEDWDAIFEAIRREAGFTDIVIVLVMYQTEKVEGCFRFRDTQSNKQRAD